MEQKEADLVTYKPSLKSSVSNLCADNESGYEDCPSDVNDNLNDGAETEDLSGVTVTRNRSVLDDQDHEVTVDSLVETTSALTIDSSTRCNGKILSLYYL